MPLLDSYYDGLLTSSLNIAIVGARGGIGNAIIEQVSNNASVKTLFACSRKLSDSGVPNKDSTVIPIPIDLSDEDSVQYAATCIRQCDIQLNIVLACTGFLHDELSRPEKSLQQLSPEHFLKSMTINALGPALVAKHFLPLMNKQSRSFFGALSARVGSISDNGLGGWHSYRASKAALNMLIKNIAIEYKRKLPHLIVAGLHPGTVDTPLSKPFQGNVKPEKLFDPEKAARQLLTVIDNLSEKDSGYCFAWDGQKIPA